MYRVNQERWWVSKNYPVSLKFFSPYLKNREVVFDLKYNLYLTEHEVGFSRSS